MDIILRNPTDVDIIDYPISECKLDKNENPIIDRDTQLPIETGTTYTWTLKANSSAQFPKYVAAILRDRYEFIESDGDAPKDEVEEPEEMPKFPAVELQEGERQCKWCGMVCKNSRALGMHMGSKHPERL